MCRYVDIWAKCNKFCAKFGKHSIAKKCVWTLHGSVTRDTWHLAEFWWNNSSPAPGTGISEQGAAAAGIWSIKCWQCRTQTCRHLTINTGCTAAAQFKTKLFFEETTKNDIIYIYKTRLRSLCYEESGECLVSVSVWHVHAQLISWGQLMTMIKNWPD